jgi:hypothetical protein
MASHTRSELREAAAVLAATMPAAGGGRTEPGVSSSDDAAGVFDGLADAA